MTDKPDSHYNLLDPADFERYAARYGRQAARSARFALAYAGPPNWNKPHTGAVTGRFSARDPKPGLLPARGVPTVSTLNHYIKQQTQAGDMMRRVLATDYSEIEQRALAWLENAGTRLHEYPPADPNPRYSHQCSAITFAAVYEANCVTDNVDDRWDDYTTLDDWRSMSYATDRGIVFG